MLPFSAACERNKGPILELLQRYFADCAHVLEIGSGTGQHAVHFAAQLGHLTWHPTERLHSLPELTARVEAEGGRNLCGPTMLDVLQPVWPMARVDALFTANTLHIMSWTHVTALFERGSGILAPRGILCVYGPFGDGARTAESNREFDRSLRERNPHSGLRELAAVTRLGGTFGLQLTADHDMPANNRMLVFTKEPA